MDKLLACFFLWAAITTGEAILCHDYDSVVDCQKMNYCTASANYHLAGFLQYCDKYHRFTDILSVQETQCVIYDGWGKLRGRVYGNEGCLLSTLFGWSIVCVCQTDKCNTVSENCTEMLNEYIVPAMWSEWTITALYHSRHRHIDCKLLPDLLPFSSTLQCVNETITERHERILQNSKQLSVGIGILISLLVALCYVCMLYWTERPRNFETNNV